MPKIDLPNMSFENLDTPMSPLRLVIRGSSVMEGRSSSLMRIRPTLLKRLRTVAIGPTYLIIDVLLQAALAELEKPGKQHDINAEDLDPTPEDFALLEEEAKPKPRPGGRNAKFKASDEPAVALPAARRTKGSVSSQGSAGGDATASEIDGDSVPAKPQRKAAGAPVSSRRKAAGAADPKPPTQRY